MSEPEFYAEFAWAIPEAFAAALHACRFEQGDVLYSEASAYDTTLRSKHPARFHIQVLDPPRTNRAAANDAEAQRFFSNWESPVTFEWMDYRAGERSERRSTQGRLFTCLWRGEIEALLDSDSDNPERPYLLRDLASRSESNAAAVLSKLGEAAVADSDKGGKPSKRHLFVTAIDQSSDTSRVKRDSITRALAEHFEIDAYSFSPTQLGLDEAERFHPALQIFAVVIGSGDSGKIEDALRDVLYVGGNAAGGEGGRFSLARHGSLIGLV